MSDLAPQMLSKEEMDRVQSLMAMPRKERRKFKKQYHMEQMIPGSAKPVISGFKWSGWKQPRPQSTDIEMKQII